MRERQPFIKKGSSEGAEMVRRREWNKEWRDDWRVASLEFGGDALETAQTLRVPPPYETPGIDRAAERQILERRLVGQLAGVRKHLADVADRNPEEVDRMFCEYLKQQPDIDAAARRLDFDYDDDEDFASFVEEHTRDQEYKPASQRQTREEVRRSQMEREMADVLTRHFMDGVSEKHKILADDLLLEVLEDRRRWMSEQEARLRARLEEVTPAVDRRFLTAAKEGALPVDPRVVEERLALLSVDVLDPLAYRLDDLDGEFNIRQHAVHLSAAIPSPTSKEGGASRLERVYAHEVLHALSGQQEVLVWASSEFGESDEDEDFVIEGEEDGELDVWQRDDVPVRVGLELSIGLGREHLEMGRRRTLLLRWLNEAVTEKVSARVLGVEPQTYAEQRELFRRLMDAGLPEDIVLRAYFENDTRKKPGHRMPAMKELFDQTNTRFGRGFLLGLDALIRDRKRDWMKEHGARRQEAEREAITQLVREWDADQAAVIARAVKRGQRRQASSVG